MKETTMAKIMLLGCLFIMFGSGYSLYMVI